MTSFSSNPSHRAAFLGRLRGVRSSADSPGGCFPSIESSPRKKLVRVAPHQRTSVSVLTWQSLMTLWVQEIAGVQSSHEQSMFAIHMCQCRRVLDPHRTLLQPRFGVSKRSIMRILGAEGWAVLWFSMQLFDWRHWLHRQTIKPQHFVCKASIFLTRPRWHRLVASG